MARRSYRLEITLAIITVIGGVGVATIYNVDKLFPNRAPASQMAPVPTVAASSATSPSEPAPSLVEEQCLKKAWDAFNTAKYESAIKFAEQCIDSFGKAADRAEEKLVNEKAPFPPTRKVSDADKERILKQGPLNDVASAYYIKGRSAEYLYRAGGPRADEYKDVAKAAYDATCRYKHARTWDPKGWFWSPCEAASDRLPFK